MYLKNEHDETDVWDGIPCYTNNSRQWFYAQNIFKMEEGGPGKFICLLGDPFMAQRYSITWRILDSLPIFA